MMNGLWEKICKKIFDISFGIDYHYMGRIWDSPNIQQIKQMRNKANYKINCIKLTDIKFSLK